MNLAGWLQLEKQLLVVREGEEAVGQGRRVGLSG